MREPTVNINGTSLAKEQAMTLRVAVTDFLTRMSNVGELGEDQTGEDIRQRYLARSTEIVSLMLSPAAPSLAIETEEMDRAWRTWIETSSCRTAVGHFAFAAGYAAAKDATPPPPSHVAGVSDDIRSYLEGVVGVVEANSFEIMCLWQRWQELGKSWVSTGHGYLATVGHVGDMPVCISILTATVDGEKILFIDPTSQVVDYRMVEDWLKTHVVTALRDDGYLNRSDAMNFSNVLGRRATLATTEGPTDG